MSTKPLVYPESRHSDDPSQPDGMTPSLLLVSPDKADVVALRKMLRGVDYPVYEATQIEAALQTVKEYRSAIILLDSAFSEKALLKMCRSVSANRLMVVLAEAGQVELVERLLEAGAADYLFKPLSEGLLRHRIELLARRLETGLQEQTDHFLAQNMRDLVMRLGTHGEIEYISPTCQALLELASADLAGEQLFAMVHPDDVESLRIALDDALVARTPQMLVFRMRRADGEYVHLDAVINEDQSLGDNREISLIVTSRDVTGRAKTIDALRRYNYELEQINQELDAYGHTIAHDLKTPLTLIGSMAALVEMDNRENISPDDAQLLQKIQMQSRRMSEMLDQLLFLARLKNARDEAAVVAVQPILEASLARFEDQLESFDVQIKGPFPDVAGHEQWLEEIFANLIGNAIKYIGEDNPDPRIEITAHLDEGMVRIAVIDNGIGIRKPDQDRLFDMFSRFHAGGSIGFGLGLAIVHRIVIRLGGEVGVRSEFGKGSEFWFTLPSARFLEKGWRG